MATSLQKEKRVNLKLAFRLVQKEDFKVLRRDNSLKGWTLGFTAKYDMSVSLTSKGLRKGFEESEPKPAVRANG